MEISKDDFVAWKNDKVTIEVMKEVQNLRNVLSDQILNGAYTGDNEELSLQIGKCIGTALIMGITHEDLVNGV